ncbi:hypothetical protein [Desulforhopalus singaporensis]|nr:hypothetical protein [Desulforhopalus singaporensis]
MRIRKVYTSSSKDTDTMYVYYKQFAERDRDRLLKRYGHDPFTCG